MTTLEDLKSELHNTFLPFILSDIIIKYNKTTIKVEFINRPTIYVGQYEFEKLDCQNVTNVDIYGILVLTNPISKFKDSKIKTITGNVVLIGDASEMFYSAIKFNSDINHWDVSQVTNMTYMFFGAINFISDISSWNTSNVTNMALTFYIATNFNSDLSNWNTSNVKDMNNMFSNTIKFNSDLSNWNTSNVVNMSFMFYKTQNFNSDLSNWNTSNVKNMLNMFEKSNKI